MKDFPIRLMSGILALFLIIEGIRSYFKLDYHPSKNKLILGDAAKEGEVQLDFITPQNLSGIKYKDLLEVRKKVITDTIPQELYRTPYLPTEIVFGRMKSGADWYSARAFYQDGPSQKAGEGISMASKIILNPLMLVVPEFWGLSMWGQGKLSWNREKIQATVDQSIIPLSPKPVLFFWNAKERKAQIDWDISSFIQQAKEYINIDLHPQDADFGITAHNARDWGLRFIAFDSAHSSNITIDKETPPIRIIDHFRFAGDFCGTIEGCNHLSNPMAEFLMLHIKQLPAEATFQLWERDPAWSKDPSTARVSPDFTYIMKFY